MLNILSPAVAKDCDLSNFLTVRICCTFVTLFCAKIIERWYGLKLGSYDKTGLRPEKIRSFFWFRSLQNVGLVLMLI
jgi:hypothetical protein